MLMETQLDLQVILYFSVLRYLSSLNAYSIESDRQRPLMPIGKWTAQYPQVQARAIGAGAGAFLLSAG